ncbi:hypothetical protein D3C78_1455300 [compost metagenome]
MHVGTVHRTTVDDVFSVDGLGAFLADVTELRGFLEFQAVAGRNRQGACGGSQSAISELAA